MLRFCLAARKLFLLTNVLTNVLTNLISSILQCSLDTFVMHSPDVYSIWVKPNYQSHAHATFFSQIKLNFKFRYKSVAAVPKPMPNTKLYEISVVNEKTVVLLLKIQSECLL